MKLLCRYKALSLFPSWLVQSIVNNGADFRGKAGTGHVPWSIWARQKTQASRYFRSLPLLHSQQPTPTSSQTQPSLLYQYYSRNRCHFEVSRLLNDANCGCLGSDLRPGRGEDWICGMNFFTASVRRRSDSEEDTCADSAKAEELMHEML
jgi:hypothetical protein